MSKHNTGSTNNGISQEWRDYQTAATQPSQHTLSPTSISWTGEKNPKTIALLRNGGIATMMESMQNNTLCGTKGE